MGNGSVVFGVLATNLKAYSLRIDGLGFVALLGAREPMVQSVALSKTSGWIHATA